MFFLGYPLLCLWKELLSSPFLVPKVKRNLSVSAKIKDLFNTSRIRNWLDCQNGQETERISIRNLATRNKKNAKEKQKWFTVESKSRNRRKLNILLELHQKSSDTGKESTDQGLFFANILHMKAYLTVVNNRELWG